MMAEGDFCMYKAIKYFVKITLIIIYGFIILSCDVNISNSGTPNTDVTKTTIGINFLSPELAGDIITIEVKRLDDNEKYVVFFSKSTQFELRELKIFILPSVDWKEREFVWVRLTKSETETTAMSCVIKPGKQHNFTFYDIYNGLHFDGYE